MLMLVVYCFFSPGWKGSWIKISLLFPSNVRALDDNHLHIFPVISQFVPAVGSPPYDVPNLQKEVFVGVIYSVLH